MKKKLLAALLAALLLLSGCQYSVVEDADEQQILRGNAAIAETAGPRALHFDTVQQALPALREQLTPGTAMLVKASHAMEFGKIVNELETTTYDRHQCDRSGQIL